MEKIAGLCFRGVTLGPFSAPIPLAMLGIRISPFQSTRVPLPRRAHT